MNRKEALYYIAGLIDGEGCISIKKVNPTKANKQANPRYYISFAISMNDKQGIELISKTLNINYRILRRKNKVNMYIINCNDNKAQEIFEILQDYLIIKRLQAQTCLDFRKMYVAQKKTKKKYHNVTYYHNKAKREINTISCSTGFSDEFLNECEKYYLYNKRQKRMGWTK